MSRRAAIIMAIVAVIMAVGAGYQGHRKVLKNVARHETAETTDFDRWLVEIPAHLRHGADIVNDRFPNPPPTMLLLAPFTFFPRAWALLPWALCKVCFAGVILWAALRMVENAGMRLAPWALAVVLAAWFWPVLGDMQEGQTNLLMLTPLALGLLLMQSTGGWKEFCGGLLIALAVAIKVTPIIFLAYGMWRGRRWMVWGIIVGLVLFLCVLPGLVVGFAQEAAWLRDWTLVMVVPYVGEGQIRVFEGQSLASFIARYLSHVPAFSSGPRGAVVQHYVNFFDLPLRTSQIIARVLTGLLVLASAWWMRRPCVTFRSRRYLQELSLLTVFMLWASAWTWVPHYVTLIFALTAAGAGASDADATPQYRRLAAVMLIAAAVLLLFTSDAAKLFSPFGTDYARTINVPLWASVCVLVAVLRQNDAQANHRLDAEGRRTIFPKNQK